MVTPLNNSSKAGSRKAPETGMKRFGSAYSPKPGREGCSPIPPTANSGRLIKPTRLEFHLSKDDLAVPLALNRPHLGGSVKQGAQTSEGGKTSELFSWRVLRRRRIRHKTQAQIASSCASVVVSRPIEPPKTLKITKCSASTELCRRGDPSRQGLPRKLLL